MHYRLGWLVAFFMLTGALFGVSEREPNDDTSQANPIACGDTVYCATLNPPGDPDYFRFTGQENDTLVAFTFNCEGSVTNTYLSLFDSTEEFLENDDDDGEGFFSRIEYVLPYSGPYFLRVVEVEPTFDTSYCLTLDCEILLPEPHDSCANARVIAAIPYQDASSTIACGDECGTAAPDVWYFFSNPVERKLIFSVCMTNFQARVQVMDSCCGQFREDSDDGCGDGAILTVYNMEVGDYYIIVEGIDAGEAGDFVFQLNGETEPCPEPTQLVLGTVGGYPFLDWEPVMSASYYIIWQSSDYSGDYEHVDTTTETYWTDSTGYSSTCRFYHVTTSCPW